MARKNKRNLEQEKKSKRELEEAAKRLGVAYEDGTPLKKKDIEPLVIKAFVESKYRWRTANGLSKQTKINYEDIFDFLEKSDLFIRARKSNKQGQPLFALREKYKKSSPFAVRLLNAITNKIH